MTGQWVQREADQHECEKPRYGESPEKPAKFDDIWKCDSCGSRWAVVTVDYGDQRDPMPMGYIRGWRLIKPDPGTKYDH